MHADTPMMFEMVGDRRQPLADGEKFGRALDRLRQARSVKRDKVKKKTKTRNKSLSKFHF